MSALTRRPALSPLKTVLYGTSTSYLKVFVRMAAGIVTFRLLFKSLSQQDFGFYQLLWSSFGYMVLLDFGFGFSLQKAMASSVQAEDEGARQVRRESISTVFYSYVALDLVLALVLFFCGHQLLGMLSYDSVGALDRYRPAAGIFALGMLLGFPLGIYREALRGLNRIHVLNFIDLIFTTLGAVLIGWGAYCHWNVTWMMIASISSTLLVMLITALVAFRNPDLRPRLRDFRLRRLSALSSFSIFAYVISMTGLIMSQCDQLVIGSLVSVQAIALYVPGFKLTTLYGTMSTQLQETLGPLAAQFGVLTDQPARAAKLGQLLLVSQRWVVMAGTLFVLPLLADTRGALSLITGVASPPNEMMHTALFLIGGAFISIAGASCSKRILMMIGHHRGLLAFSLLEATINLTLSVYLTLRLKSCVGVAAGTFIATVCVSLVAVPAYASGKLALPAGALLSASARGFAANLGAIAAAAIWWLCVPPFQPLWVFASGCGVCAIAALPGWWYFGMLATERARIVGRRSHFETSLVAG